MSTSTRIKGRALSLKLGSTDYWADATSVMLDSEDPDVLTFFDASEAGRKYFFTIDAIQSTDASSFWSHVWANSGDDNVAFIYAPHGNATASASQPHFTGTLRIGNKPSIGGAAGVNTTFTFTTRFDINGEPTLVTS
jgi:hypothetical protein